MNSSNL
jgi:hypothetical protein